MSERLFELTQKMSQKLDVISEEQTKQSVMLEYNQKSLSKLTQDVEDLARENIVQTKDIAANKDSLVEHMEQTMLIRKQLSMHAKDNEDRFEKIEAPKKFRKGLWDIFLKAGGGAGAMYAIIKLIDYLKSQGMI